MPNVVTHFRGSVIPSYVRSKSDLIRYVLINHRHDTPISNGEFVFDLRCTRFGGVLHDLRKEGWDIATLNGKENGHFLYYLVSCPSDEAESQRNLRLL